MKIYYYFVGVLFCCLAMANVHAQSGKKVVSEVENRFVYAMGSDMIASWGMISFYTGPNMKENQTLLGAWQKDRAIYAGAAANDKFYGYVYDYAMGPVPVGLANINPRTGEIINFIQDWSGLGQFKFQDMTYDYSTQTMYAVGYTEDGSYLYKVDLNTGDISEIAKLNTQVGEVSSISTIAATYDGRLYAMGSGTLYQVEKESGILTKVFDTEKRTTYLHSMEFDHTDEALYWAANHDKGNDVLYKIDVDKKTIKEIGALKSQTQGLYIPFVKDGFGVPGVVSDFKVIAGTDGKEEAEITWKNPIKTHGGQDMTGNLSITVQRDGKTIGTTLGEAGAEMLWQDKTVESGEHMYTLKIKNGVGEGVNNNIDAFVGKDVPARVTDFAQSIGTDCKSIKLSWTVPTKGEHDGFYDQTSVTFKIVRQPDNKVIEESFKGTSYEDKTMTRLAPYYYEITPMNNAGVGKGYYSPGVLIAGPALSLSGEGFVCSFEESGLVTSQWSIVDENEDDHTWYLNSGTGAKIWGDGYFAAEFFPLERLDDPADEWLISPPLNFEAGKEYHLSFQTRSSGVDVFDVTFGKLNTPGTQEQFIYENFITEDVSDGGAYTNHLYQLPKVEGVHCFGIHLRTEAFNSGLFQFTNVLVEEADFNSIESNKAQQSVIRTNNGILEIEGIFNSAEVYDASGTSMASLSSDNSHISTSGWHAGIYIIKVTGADSVYTRKVVIK